MDEITRLSLKSVQRYFDVLSKLGYINSPSTDKLLALLFIEELLYTFNGYISEEDFHYIMKAIYCLSGSTCLIDYPEYINDDEIIHGDRVHYIDRISEDNILRETQDNLLRIKE